MRNLELWKCGAKNGICVETRTYVGTSFVRKRGQYEVVSGDVELSCWLLCNLDRFVFDCADSPKVVTYWCVGG